MKVLFACFIYYVVAYHKCTHICPRALGAALGTGHCWALARRARSLWRVAKVGSRVHRPAWCAWGYCSSASRTTVAQSSNIHNIAQCRSPTVHGPHGPPDLNRSEVTPVTTVHTRCPSDGDRVT